MENLDPILKEKLVIYDNSFNKTSLSILTEIQSDILMAVLEKMGEKFELNEKGEKCYVARYKFKEIRDMIDSQHMQAQKIKKALKILTETEVKMYENGEYLKSKLFSDCFLIDRSTVEIVLSSKLTSKLFVRKKEYTILQIEEYINLKTRYSKELYRFLRQFRHSGYFLIKKEDLIESLRPPKSYNEYDFIRKALLPAIEENKKYFKNLKIINMEKNGNAFPRVCKFTFEKHKKVEKTSNKTSYKGKTKEEIELLEYIMENGGC